MLTLRTKRPPKEIDPPDGEVNISRAELMLFHADALIREARAAWEADQVGAWEVAIFGLRVAWHLIRRSGGRKL